MALDESSDNDEVFKEEGFDVVVEKQLLSQIKGVTIDFISNHLMGSGFRVSSSCSGDGCSCENGS